MIPGVVAQGMRLGGGGGGPIPIDAGVVFNSAYLTGTLSCIDNEFFGFSVFVKTDWTLGPIGQVIFMVDPEDNFMSSLQGFGASTHHIEFNVTSLGDAQHVTRDESGTTDTAWHHLIGACKTNLGAGSKIIKLYKDAVDVSGAKTDTNTSFTVSSDGFPLFVGWNGDPFGQSIPKFAGSMCNLSVWPGTDLLTGGSTITSTTIELFRKTDGHPEDPQVAIDALGAPAVFLAGTAAQFANNTLGTSGPFSLITGSLTDDPSGP